MAPHTRSKWHITDEKEKEKEAKEKEHVAEEKEPVTEPMQVNELEEPTISETTNTSSKKLKKKQEGQVFIPMWLRRKSKRFELW